MVCRGQSGIQRVYKDYVQVMQGSEIGRPFQGSLTEFVESYTAKEPGPTLNIQRMQNEVSRLQRTVAFAAS